MNVEYMMCGKDDLGRLVAPRCGLCPSGSATCMVLMCLRCPTSPDLLSYGYYYTRKASSDVRYHVGEVLLVVWVF
jgi:hypothetical protein